MRPRFIESLRARLMMLVALALVPAIALTAFSAIEERAMQADHVEQGNLRLARLLANDQAQLAEQTRQILTTLHLSDGDAWFDPASCPETLAAFQGRLPYDNLGAYDAFDSVACSQRPVSPAVRAHVNTAQRTGDFTVGAYEIDHVRQVSSLTFALPFSDPESGRKGALFATARADWFTHSASKTALPPGSIVMIVDTAGRIVAQYPEDGASIGTPVPATALHDAMTTQDEGVLTAAGADGEPTLFAFAPVRGATEPVHVAVGAPRGPALADASAAFTRDLAMLVVVGAIAMGAAWVASDAYVMRHMRRLVGTTLRLRSGVMTARTGIPRGHGEFSQLARWFDEMAAALQREHEELRRLGRLELYKLLAENATDLISRLTPQGSILYASPAARRILGHDGDGMRGRFIAGLAHPDDADATRAALGRALMGGPVTMTHRLRRADGGFVWMETTAQPVRDADGHTTELIAVSRDITERKRTETALEDARKESEAATRAKSEFLANMSHEIRTPMNAVIGMTSLLQDTRLDAEQAEFVETIRGSGDHLLSVINDILDFSKIESGRLELERHVFDPQTTVEEAMDLVAPAASGKGLELVCDIDLPDRVEGDSSRLRQVLVNLLSNAVKFTERGEVVVRGRAEREGAAWRLSFSVTDTGIGIPPDRLDGLFRPFSQVDASTTRHYGGSGLGLAICRHLCTMMDGDIEAKSEPARGSEFRFHVRAYWTDAAPVATTPEPGLAGRRALVVDDNATNRRVLTLQLERWGLITTALDTPAAALQALDDGARFDLALLDHRMPGMDGDELARAAHARQPDLPLLLLSSIGHGRGATARIGATLTKPVKPRALHDALVRLLRAPSNEPQQAPEPRFDETLAKRNPLRILLVEDNAVNQKVATRLLARFGYTADLAGNGLEAVQATKRQAYDLVLMDIQMPEMDGLEATRLIRTTHTELRIVAMTAHASADHKAACLAAGMDDHLTKPLQVERIRDALERAAPQRSVTP